MESKKIFCWWLLMMCIKSTEMCLDEDSNKFTSFLLITFGSGSDQYSNKTPSDFGFTKDYGEQRSATKSGEFAFINSVPSYIYWHDNASDHTPNDIDGHMYFVDVITGDSVIFNSIVYNLCIGMHYVFSAYLANVVKKPNSASEPNIRFEVQTVTVPNGLITRSPRYTIHEYYAMTWSKYNVSFIASSTSVMLLIIEIDGKVEGNDLAIDDIDLSVCSAIKGGTCPSDSVRLCSDDNTNSGEPLMLITFGSGSDQCSNKTSSDFNFTTSYQQQLKPFLASGDFAFIRSIPTYATWHKDTPDHTPNDDDGYMYLMDFNTYESQIFNSTINNLCIGSRYAFSAYFANIHEKSQDSKPNVRFEVRSAISENSLLAQLSTGDIPEYSEMTWSKHGLSFTASTSSVILLMIAVPSVWGGGKEGLGGDLAIDDIELRACFNLQRGFCPSGCIPTKITLLTKPSNSSTIEYKFNDDIHISSTTQTNCAQLYPIEFQWTIFNNSTSIKLDESVKTTLKEIYIPPKTLTDGAYRFQLRVMIVIASTNLTSSESIYIKILRSQKLIVILIEYGLLQITLGQCQELLLESEKYSTDTDGNKLTRNVDISNETWEYEYYCRLYGREQSFSPMETSSCGLSKINRTGSSLKILANSFQPNRSYQFQVQAYNHENPSLKHLGYLLVHSQTETSYRIAIGCIISTMCIADASVATRIFRPMGKLLLWEKNRVGKVKKFFFHGQKSFVQQKKGVIHV